MGERSARRRAPRPAQVTRIEAWERFKSLVRHLRQVHEDHAIELALQNQEARRVLARTVKELEDELSELAVALALETAEHESALAMLRELALPEPAAPKVDEPEDVPHEQAEPQEPIVLLDSTPLVDSSPAAPPISPHRPPSAAWSQRARILALVRHTHMPRLRAQRMRCLTRCAALRSTSRRAARRGSRRWRS